jgi:Replication-relaxation
VAGSQTEARRGRRPSSTTPLGVLVATAAGGIAVLVLLLSGLAAHPLVPRPGQEAAKSSTSHQRARSLEQGQGRGQQGQPAGDAIGRFAARAIALLGLAAVAVGCRRTLARRRRQMQRVLVTPGRTSEATPTQVAGMVEALSRVTRDRWWTRLWKGTPPAATLEIVSGEDRAGSAEQRVGIAVPAGDRYLRALRGILASRYPDAVLTPLADDQADALLRWLKVVIFLQKARPFAAPIAHPAEQLRAPSDSYAEAPLDVVLAVMTEAEGRSLLQLVVTPAPNWFQRFARWAAGRAPERRGSLRPGAVEQREDRAAAEAVVFRPLGFCEIRVAAENRDAARHIAGAIEGIAEGAENQLRQRCPVLRRRLYARRMARAESNPAPSWMRGVFSSLEVAGLWHLPTPYAKGVAIRRSNVPQLPAPPEVLKLDDKRLAIATDLNGTYIGMRPSDWKYGVQVSGMAGGGKTSLLTAIARVRSRDPNAAVIVLDPKGELAEAVVAEAPSWRTVRFLDFGRPLFGIALETPGRDLPAEAAIFSQAMVDVSRTEEGESQALNASQRSFKMARGATLALEQEPTFWHTARWLASDDDAAEWRKEKIAELAGDPQWHGVWDHFARILPAQLQKSPSQTVMRLEAPYNKIQTLLGDERLNTVLHHPVKVSFDQVIRRREMLVVAGRIPEHPDAEVLLKFFVQLAHRAILGQHALPEDERARVAFIGDDASYIFTPTIARMMELDRSAGLEIVLGWQHGGQLNPELEQAIDGLCNSRFYLRAAQEDAERFINRLNPAYESRIGGGLDQRQRMRVEVNQMTALDVSHAVAVLHTGGAVSNSFTVRTLPWKRDLEKLAIFEERMRGEGAYDPEVIAPPAELTGRGANVDVPDVGVRAADGHYSEESGALKGGSDSPSSEAADVRTRGDSGSPGRDQDPGGDPAPVATRTVRRGRREAEVADLGCPTDKKLSEAYQEVELMRDKASSINWEEPPSDPPDARHNKLNAEKRAILEALFELRVLSGAQIRREFLMAMSDRQARRELGLLFQRRMVRRFELGLRGGRGRGKRAYVLDVAGFEQLRDAADHEASGAWRPPELKSPQHVVHDLARNEWLFGFRSLAPRNLSGWRGTRTGKIEVPLVREPRQAPRRLAPIDLRESAPVGFAGDEYGNVIPDLTLELQLRRPDGGEVRTDLLVEIESGNNDGTVRRKAREYDGFLTGWWKRHPRYERLGRPPIVFFVVPDLSRARRFIELLDEELTAHLVGPATTQTREQRDKRETPQPEHLYLGRRNIFVAVGRDVHQRTLRAWRVPAEPKDVRSATARSAADRHRLKRPTPRPFMLIDLKEQVDPAR